MSFKNILPNIPEDYYCYYIPGVELVSHGKQSCKDGKLGVLNLTLFTHETFIGIGDPDRLIFDNNEVLILIKKED